MSFKPVSLCVYLASFFLAVGFASDESVATAQDGTAPLTELPVTELTVFKDGHSLLVRSGELSTQDGNVQITDLPSPVLGTFWPFVGPDVEATLRSVTVGDRTVTSDREAKNHAEFIRANVGNQVAIQLRPGEVLEGTIESVPKDGTTFLLRTRTGFRLLRTDAVNDITFDESFASTFEEKSQVRSLEMDLEWDDDAPEKASVGMMYLQKGIRWIPSYKIDLGEDGKATLRLQATLVNELIDLKGASVQLVVGVPSFRFQDTVDPISGSSVDPNQAVQQQLSGYFRPGSQAAYAFSNSLTTQVARMGDTRGAPVRDSSGDQPDLIHSEGNPGELYFFSVADVTLKKGERQVVTLDEWKLSYEEIYKLEVDSLPPTEFQQYRNNRNTELASLLAAPKVHRYLRLTNESEAPLTTAPALILDTKGKVLAQSMMTYASVGSRVDLEMTTAVDIQVSREDIEKGRKPNALTHNGDKYMRVDLTSTIRLTNYRKEPLKVEVVRRLIGGVDAASDEGKVITPMYGDRFRYRPAWWWSYNWPYWWSHLNSIQTTRWEIELPGGESKSVSVDWHYFWR